MMRALCVIESAAIGDTEIERAFPASDSDYDGPVYVSRYISASSCFGIKLLLMGNGVWHR